MPKIAEHFQDDSDFGAIPQLRECPTTPVTGVISVSLNVGGLCDGVRACHRAKVSFSASAFSPVKKSGGSLLNVLLFHPNGIVYCVRSVATNENFSTWPCEK